MNKSLPFKGRNIRIPTIIPIKGRGFINHGSTLGRSGWAEPFEVADSDDSSAMAVEQLEVSAWARKLQIGPWLSTVAIATVICHLLSRDSVTSECC